jgi:uncharacterized protein
MTEQASVPPTERGQEESRHAGLRPVPKPDELTRPYWDGAAEHRLRIMRCRNCQAFRHPPQVLCPVCGSGEAEWVDISGRGHIYSYIVDYRLLMPGFGEPYVVVQVNPVEASEDTVRITANLRDCPFEKVHIGMSVEVIFEECPEGVTLPQFRPASAAG